MCVIYRIYICAFVEIPRWILIFLVRVYKRFVSPLSVGACRYYPSCSEYAMWLLKFDNPFLAAFKSLARILTCNQLFSGGIAYPQATLSFQNIIFTPKNVKYWFVPSTNKAFLGIMGVFKKTYTMRVYIIKSL